MAQYIDLYVSPAGVCFNEGYAHWEAVTIGGITPDGFDATNELSYIFLENKRELPLNYPDLAARIHSTTSDRFLHEVARTIKDGTGFPKLLNDEEIIPLLLSKGAPFEDANDYAVSGCAEVRMVNRDTYTSAGPYINLAAAVELTLYNGRMPAYGDELLTIETGKSFDTWEEFFAAYLKQQEYLIRQGFRQYAIVEEIRSKHFAAPFGSSLHDLCRKYKRDLHSGKIEGGVDLGYFDLIGYGSVVDSLSAVKKCVYEDKTISIEALKNALLSDFEDNEVLRRILMKAPKYGNNDEYADEIAKEVDRQAVLLAKENYEKTGIYTDLRYVPVTSHIPFGKVIGALPNGRKKGVALSDGTSASHGADSSGPTAILLSNYKTKNRRYNNRAARLLNLKLSPSTVAGEEGTEKLMSFIRTWRDLKLWHLQFNVVNQETLKKAKEHPEDYRDLIIRVAGYSAYFVDLTPDLQDDIIMRTEHEAI
jgi:formate C-acetyltransferase